MARGISSAVTERESIHLQQIARSSVGDNSKRASLQRHKIEFALGILTKARNILAESQEGPLVRFGHLPPDHAKAPDQAGTEVAIEVSSGERRTGRSPIHIAAYNGAILTGVDILEER